MKYGFTCGAFDLLHLGHVRMLREAKKQCDYLIVGVQKDPSVDRSEKHKPVMSHTERMEFVSAIKYVDEIVAYSTEKDLVNLLKGLVKKKKIDVRIIGEDWKGKEYTGRELNIPIYFNQRKHRLSSSYLRKLVKRNFKKL